MVSVPEIPFASPIAADNEPSTNVVGIGTGNCKRQKLTCTR
jgi:hypothetical protein